MASISATYHKIVPAPEKPSHLPNSIYWLSGEGCGSWFYIEENENNHIISRYSPDGKLECKGLFELVKGSKIKLTEQFEITYLSHCAEVNVIQHNNQLQFKLINKLSL